MDYYQFQVNGFVFGMIKIEKPKIIKLIGRFAISMSEAIFNWSIIELSAFNSKAIETIQCYQI